jgi:hypothetical protein
MNKQTLKIKLNVETIHRKANIEWVGILSYKMGRLQADYIKVIRGANETFFVIDLSCNMRPSGFPKALIGNQHGDYEGGMTMMYLNMNYANIRWANPIFDFDKHMAYFYNQSEELDDLQSFAVSEGLGLSICGQCFIAQANEHIEEVIERLLQNSQPSPCINLNKIMEGACEYFGNIHDNKKAKEAEKKRIELFHENRHLKRKIDHLEHKIDSSKKKPKVKYTEPSELSNVYIMKDCHSGFYKIGKSKNPRARESTLQSEKPSIKMVFTAPECDRVSERTLHSQFSNQRIRGEWFDLTPAQVRYICHQLKTNE